jgi:murein DD-endopeptidase MepM/ murein hydrolase activator NlpD
VIFAALAAPLSAQPPQLLRCAVIPENPLPGEPVCVAVAGAGSGLRLALADSQGRRIAKADFWTMQPRAFIRGSPAFAALLTVPSTAQTGFASLRIERNGNLLKEIPIIIQDREFVSEVIELNKRNTEIRTVQTPQKTAQAERLWAALSRTGADVYTSSAFSPPLAPDTRRTSFFGDRRVYRYNTGDTATSVHAGIDYGVPTGTVVAACADGRVTLAEFRESTGYSVVVEHLPGVYSLYYHLSKITVKENALVKQGDTLGESGATGLATGPHLHWEIRVSGENTDPDICVSRPLFDRAALLSLLYL